MKADKHGSGLEIMRRSVQCLFLLVILLIAGGCAERTPPRAATDPSHRLVGAPPAKFADTAEILNWYTANRGGIAGQFAVEDRGVRAFVVWAPRAAGALYTPTSTYVRPKHLDYYVLYDDQAIKSLDCTDGVMRHFGAVQYWPDGDYLGYFLLPDEILSHGMLLHEFSKNIKAVP